MKRLFLCLLLCALAPDQRAQNVATYILAANRTPTAELIDSSTLATVVSIQFDFPIERMSAADPLHLTVAGYPDGRSCCREYTLDLATLNLTLRAGSPSRDTFRAPQFSPDGRWAARLRNYPNPVLKITDRASGASHDLIPPGLSLREEDCGGNWAVEGVWSPDHFFLYVSCPKHPGFLWSVPPAATELGTEVQVDPFNQQPACNSPLPLVRSLFAAGPDLFIYEPAGTKGSRACSASPPGGLWRLDSSTGRLHDPIALNRYFGQVLSNASGSVLYGVVHAFPTSTGAAQLVTIDPQSGNTLKSRDLHGQVWSISMGELGAVPGGDLKAVVSNESER